MEKHKSEITLPLLFDPISHRVLIWFFKKKTVWILLMQYNLLVSGGHLCDLQGMFSEINNLLTVNHIELQLMSNVISWHCDVMTLHGDGYLQTWKKDATDATNLWLTVYLSYIWLTADILRLWSTWSSCGKQCRNVSIVVTLV